jgi:hypothetical protein
MKEGVGIGQDDVAIHSENLRVIVTRTPGGRGKTAGFLVRGRVAGDTGALAADAILECLSFSKYRFGGSSIYNGFSAEERGASSRWERELLRSGWKRPTKCIACGQNRGVVDAHLEDYSQPFEISRQIPLCYRCHIFAVHLRHRYPVQTAVYRSWVRRGFRAPALFTRNFGRLVSDHVTHAALVDWQFGGVPVRCILDKIAEGKLCPPGRVPGNVPARQHKKSDPGAK